MTKTIVIANQKGGVAKTTTAVTLAHGLALKGHEVVIFDLDPQGQCASALGREHEPGVFNLLVSDHPLADVLRTTGRPRLSLLPGDKRTKTAEVVLIAEGRLTPDLLIPTMRELGRTGVDFCVVDTSPSVGGLVDAALFVADLVIIPTAVDYLSSEGVAATLSTMQAVNGKGGRARLFGVLPTFYDRTRETRAVMADLATTLGREAILSPEIHRAVLLREAAAAGKTIFETEPTSRPAEQYAALVWGVIRNGKT